MQKLDPKGVWILFLRSIFGWLFFFVILSFWLSFMLASFETLVPLLTSITWWMVLIFIVLFVIFCWVWAKLSYHFWRYQLTEDVFKKEHGVIWKKYVSIPYDRIQNVDIYRGIIARILGLSTISIQTAGYGAVGGRSWGWSGEGYLPGLDKNVAEQLREELIKRAKGSKQGL